MADSNPQDMLDGCTLSNADVIGANRFVDWELSTIDSQLNFSIHSNESFSGFESNEMLGPNVPLLRVLHKTTKEKSLPNEDKEPEHQYNIVTRARGKAPELPTVQPWTLERKRKQ